MITEKHGDLLDDDADALVNTVNCVGVMGNGIALAFKRRWPAMYASYQEHCRRGLFRPGSVRSWQAGPAGQQNTAPLIVNVATKDHWRDPSRIEWIDQALQSLVQLVRDERLRSIAVPPLGCGNGGLDWNDVRPRIHRVLGTTLSNVDVRLYTPEP
ncbi:macro domain-containing protein [Streptomyces sp. NPDC088254]|uniref:macro domain-containing protein n=1 Tax=Streptomyces sp. NPDC088254 TaxID=3365847 RepID=UPI0038257438